MNGQSGSKTAIGAAVLRAAHQLLDGEPRVLYDDIVLQLLGKAVCDDIVHNKGRFYHPYATLMRTSIVLRSRYAEDRLKLAYEKGIRQYLLLGAGLDTFAYRQPAWAESLRIWEADHPTSGKAKSELLYKADIPVPENIMYVPVDLENDDLAAIFSGIIDLTEPVFISCLGVLVYLEKQTCEKIFRFVASLATGSEFVFTARQNNNDNVIAQRAAQAGEPWITHFSEAELQYLLKECGFSDIHFLTAAEIGQLYSDANIIRLFPPQRSSVVRAGI